MSRHTISIDDFYFNLTKSVLASTSVTVLVDGHYFSKQKILSFAVYVARPNEYFYELSFNNTITMLVNLEEAVAAYNEI